MNLLQAQARSEGSHEYYEDMASLLKARKTDNSASGGVTIGISYVEVGIRGSSEEKFLTNITKYQSQVKSTDAHTDMFDKITDAHSFIVCFKANI